MKTTFLGFFIMRVPGYSSSNRKFTDHTNTLMYTEERNIHPMECIGNVYVDIPKYLVKTKQKTELHYKAACKLFFLFKTHTVFWDIFLFH